MAAHYQKGTYPATIVGQGFVESKYGWQFVLKIEPQCNGEVRERTVFLALTDEQGNRAQYADQSIEVIKHLGFHGGDANLARLDPADPEHHSFLGLECQAYCTHKEKDGDVFERWYINTPRSGGVEYSQPNAIAMKKLQSLFGKELKDSPEPKSVTEQTQAEVTQEATTAASGGDDVPF